MFYVYVQGDSPAVVQTGAGPQQVIQLNQPHRQPVFRDIPVLITDSKGQQVDTVMYAMSNNDQVELG